MSTMVEKLSALQNQQLIEPIDVEFCRFLQRQDPDISEAVLMAACLVSHAYRQGDICVPLAAYASQQLFGEQEREPKIIMPAMEEWLRQLKQSCIVGKPGDFTPLILDEDRSLYLHKIWHYEQQLAQEIFLRAQKKMDNVDEAILREGVQRLFGEDEDVINWQKVAAIAAVYNHLTVISGGPGTGKTTTVVRLLALILEQGHRRGELPAIALAAPTGKAAKRLQQAILEAKEQLDLREEIKQAIPGEVITIHQLLGARQHTAQFRHNAENPLPYDLVIIDEASMVDQALMSKLMTALLGHAKLILLGDKDQLASVEAGSVLGDICGDQPHPKFSDALNQKFQLYSVQLPAGYIERQPKPLTDHVILLTKSYRFSDESGIGMLADAINEGNKEKAIAVLQSELYPEVSLQTHLSYSAFIEMIVQRSILKFKTAIEAPAEANLFKIYNRSIILAAHRKGPWGVNRINDAIEEVLQKEGMIPRTQLWYHGKPVMITQNDYSLGLNNGDFGVCMATSENTFRIIFERTDGTLALPPSRLAAYSTAFALTVHKSQGSEFEEVMLVLPQKASRILSRELLYTAVTRTKKEVAILGEEQIINTAMQNRLTRHSGLGKKLWLKKRAGKD